MATTAPEGGRTAPGGTARLGGWKPLTLLLTLLVLLNYVDRGALGIAAPGLKDEFHLSALQFGVALSAFAWVYAPAQFAVGWLSDRFCVYRLVAVGLAIWAVSTMLTATATGLAMLVALRIGLGIGEGVAFPSISKMIAAHVPQERRGLANAWVAAALAAGPALGTLAGGHILNDYGWRAIFLIFGAITLLWLMPWHFVSRTHWHVAGQHREPSVAMRDILRRRAVWTMGIGHFCNTYAFFFLLAWLPLFLVKQRGLSILEMTGITTSVFALQAVCALLWGWLSDRLVHAGHDEGRLRKAFIAASLTCSAIAVLGLSQADTTASIEGWLLLAGAGAGPAGTQPYAIAQIFAGRRASGSWVGAVNGIGNTSGIVGPLITGAIVDRTGSYVAAFLLAAGISAFGALWWLFAVPKVEPVAAFH
ncbi:MFS transporter [Sphingomonas sp.]|uniref:MFS transporter n=1 Tax=Sphingomonas sp. TaxID=28214 RepID=UPI00286B65EC|nr:MFS transporter [Sphingomonas sp.]